MSDERGGLPRHPTFKGGNLVFNNGFSAPEWTIRNLSGQGSCLDMPSTVGVPDKFDLVSMPERVTRPCSVAWRTERRSGVSFE